MAKKSKRKQAKKRKRPGGNPATRSPAEREFEAALDTIRRRAAEAQAPGTPPQRVAEIVAEDFEGLPSPVGLVDVLVERASAEHARAVVDAVAGRAPGSLAALTLAAEAARVLDGDQDRAGELLDEALACAGTDVDAPLAEHLLEAGDALSAAECIREAMLDEPEDEHYQQLQARALEELYGRASSRSRRRRDEARVLDDFADRTLVYRLRDAMRTLVETRPSLERHVASRVHEWLETAGMLDGQVLVPPAVGEEEQLDPEQEALVRLAIEHSWRSSPEDYADDADEDGTPALEGDPSFADSGTPLALLAAESAAVLAADPAALVAADPGEFPPANLGARLAAAEAARDWYETCTYGLWLVADPEPRPGVWLTEIVSGTRRYVAIAPEQLEGLHRWSVILGPVIAIEGVWRTGGTFISMRPGEGDGAAALVREAAADLVRVLEGKRARGPRQRPRVEPLGVLADVAEPSDPGYADLVSKITGHLLPTLASAVRQQRTAPPMLTNTEGHTVKLITATLGVGDDADVRAALGEHGDFHLEEEGEISWWGRELTAAERESALAEISAQLAAAGELDSLGDVDERPRWLRGRLRAVPRGIEIEVNSRERLEELLEALRHAGLEPELRRETTIDPRQDLPLSSALGPLPFGSSPEAARLWSERWPNEPSPALGGATPRVAAGRERDRPILEALLRTLEHDADILARRGQAVPDFAALRAELGMERWWD
jgi:hypothetical protein